MSVEDEVAKLRKELDELKKVAPAKNKLSIVFFSGYLDRAMAAMIIATGAAAAGMEVTIFFTFWGTPMLIQPGQESKPKLWLQKMFGWVMPHGTKPLSLSRMNFGGMGTMMMKRLMRHYNTASVEDLLQAADEMGVQFNICEMTMQLMGISREQIRPLKNLTWCGVATFIADAAEAKHLMFI